MEMWKEEIKIEIWKPFLLHCPYVHKALPLPLRSWLDYTLTELADLSQRGFRGLDACYLLKQDGIYTFESPIPIPLSPLV